jgi:CRISPR-associated protein Csm1
MDRAMMDESERKEYQSIILAALLHDIGKLVQRAQTDPAHKTHQEWGKVWFEKTLSRKLVGVFGSEGNDTISSAIGGHHGTMGFVSLADCISAGVSGIELHEEESLGPFSQRLVSIFSRISVSEKEKKEMYHKLMPLGQEQLEETFPVLESKCSFKEYSLLLNGFEKDIAVEDFDAVTATGIIDYLSSLLLKHTWCVPSPPNGSDVSLYDHLKTTAAIAGCLYTYHKANHSVPLDLENKAFCLVGGDVSGIQNYIFDVLNQQGKVAKRLRARSFFVQTLSEVAAYKVLQTLALPLCNLIMSAGGNFYILAPNTSETHKGIAQLRREFDEWGLHCLGAELSVSLASVELSGIEMAIMTQPIDRLKVQLRKQKSCPYGLALMDGDHWLEGRFVRPEAVDGDVKVCAGCHKHSIKDIEPNPDNLCEHCLDDVLLGSRLFAKPYIAFSRKTKENRTGYSIFDHLFQLWDDQDFDLMLRTEPYLVLNLNNPKMKLPVGGFKYCVTHIPTGIDNPSVQTPPGDPLTFDGIAELGQGDRLLGYIKADVDNLGFLLQEGFSKDGEHISISRLTSFSRMLETFFSGYIQQKLKTGFKSVYTVFSGGDDFFVVGPWNIAIDFARHLREDFSRFCAHNPDLTFSCGVFLSQPHVPIAFCAGKVEDALSQSKTELNKDSITLFNQTLSWEELNIVLNQATKWIHWLTDDPPSVSRELISSLRKYGGMARRSGIFGETNDVSPSNLKFLPLLIYDIKRNLNKENQEDAYSWCIDLRPTPEKGCGGTNLPYLEVTMEYVLTYTRSHK